MMLATFVDLLVTRLLRGQCLHLVLTPLPPGEQLAMILLVPRLVRWRVKTEWN